MCRFRLLIRVTPDYATAFDDVRGCTGAFVSVMHLLGVSSSRFTSFKSCCCYFFFALSQSRSSRWSHLAWLHSNFSLYKRTVASFLVTYSYFMAMSSRISIVGLSVDLRVLNIIFSLPFLCRKGSRGCVKELLPLLPTPSKHSLPNGNSRVIRAHHCWQCGSENCLKFVLLPTTILRSCGLARQSHRLATANIAN
jgi:hypothetical protein